MNVSNGKCIRDLSRKSLRANRTRNLIAVLAIALTTDRKSTRLNSSHSGESRMPSSA